MPKLLQIDSCLNMLSTGRITESIGQLAIERGWEVYIVHGARAVRKPSCMNTIQSDKVWQEYLHYAESLLFDRHGLASRGTTKKVVEQIKKLNPDVIQLHCIHGYYLNYKILFEYLNTTNIPIVWTFHDCWAFTGHCAHFATVDCQKWKSGCYNCPLKADYPKSIADRSGRNYYVKKMLFSANKNLHIVTVSEWLASFTRESFLGNKDIRVINNGVDINLFKPYCEKSNDKFKILGVASSWNKEKGLYDFYKLRELLSRDQYEITMVGLTKDQIAALPKGIRGISRTNSIDELAHLYSEAHVFINPTYADSFPTVNMESISCGTPVITYRTGGSPEIIDERTGFVVEKGDVNAIVNIIKKMKVRPIFAEDCRERAVKMFNKNERFLDYIKLYQSLIHN